MYIGLDLGTSGLKGLVIDNAQQLRAEASVPLTVARPHPGWSEQDPADWIRAAEHVLDALSEQVSFGAIRAIGLSGQMHGATLIDQTGNALRPCILWNDTRAADQAAALDASPAWRESSGNIVFPGFTAPKLSWVKDHEPTIFNACAKVLLPKDYLRFWLTGAYVSEMSDAAGTSWLDTRARRWNEDRLAETGLDLSHMPDLVEGSEPSAQIRPAIAQRFGLPTSVLVAGGAGDNAASAIGAGVTKPGEGFLSLGTSGVLFAATGGYHPAPDTAVHSFCHALPGMWHQMGVILAATDALNWYARFVQSTAQELSRDLGPLQAPGQTCFLPYLSGERTPLNDAAVRGAFMGLEHATDRSAGTRAVMEGVGFAFADCLKALRATGTQLDSVIALGGGSQSRYWLELLATVLNLPIELPKDGEFGAAFGAARLGMMACGASLEIATKPEIADVIEPDTTLQDAFSAAYTRYQAGAKFIQHWAHA